MSDTMLLNVLRMPYNIALDTEIGRIQYYQRGLQAADEIEKLRDAMQFYADPNRYKSTSVHMCGHSTGQSVMIDGGRKAREALGVKPRHTTQQSSS
jgi:hypothetical protein